MGCTPECHNFGHTYGIGCVHRRPEPPLAQWERDILMGEPLTPDTVAVATFHLNDGTELVFENVNVDSIGPSAEHPGVIGVEFDAGDIEIAHVPFVRWWSIEYR